MYEVIILCDDIYRLLEILESGTVVLMEMGVLNFIRSNQGLESAMVFIISVLQRLKQGYLPRVEVCFGCIVNSMLVRATLLSF